MNPLHHAPRVALALVAVALMGCATTPTIRGPQGAGFIAAAPQIETPPPMPSPVALTAEVRRTTVRRGRDLSPTQTLVAANSAARQRPTRDSFNAARHIYQYQPGVLYELYTSPNFISTILLEPGETLGDIAAGDTSRWMVSETTTETDSDGRTIVLVKPQAIGLRTNIVLITDRRTYLIEAISQAGDGYSAQVAWSYPRDSVEQANATPLDALRLDYRIRTIRGRTPIWSPTRVFDDGRRTWIEFAPQVAAADMPPLFVITGEGPELVNYRVIQREGGQRYMVDRVFDVAELRLGVRASTIVRIERRSAMRARPARQRSRP